MFIHLCFRAVVHVCRYNLVQSCPCVCTIVQSHTLVPLCMHHCTTAYPCALVHAQLHTLMQSCACTLVLAPLRNRVPLFSRALVRLCLHNYTQYAMMLSCSRAFVHALTHTFMQLYACAVVLLRIHALVQRSQERQGSEEIPAVPAYMMVMPSRT